MASLGRLTIDMVANLGGFETDMKRAARTSQRELNKVSRQLRFAQRDADAAAARIRNLGLQLAAVAGVGLGLVVREFRNLSREADRIQKLGIATGLTAEAVQELGFAAEQAGSDFETVVRGVQQLQRNIQQASDGLATYTRAFERANVAVEDLIGLSPEQQFRRVAQAISEIEDPTARTATAMEIFGRAGRELLPLLSQGEAGIERFANQLRRTGAVMSQETVDAAARFNDALNLLRRNVQGMKVALFSDLIQPLANVAEFFADADRGADSFRQLLNALKTAALAAAFVIATRFTLSLTIAIVQLVQAQRQVNRLNRELAAMGVASAAAATRFAALGRAITLATGPIGILITIIGTFAIATRGLIPEIREAATATDNYRKRLDELIASGEAAAQMPFQRALAEISAEMIELSNRTADLVREREKLNRHIPAGFMGEEVSIRERLREINEEIKENEERLVSLNEVAADYSDAMDEAANNTRKFGDEATGTAKDIKAFSSATKDFEQTLNQLEATLEGTTAQLRFGEQLAEAVTLFAAGEISIQQLTRAYRLYSRELEEATRKTDDFAEAIDAILFAADPLSERLMLLQIAIDEAIEAGDIERAEQLARAYERIALQGDRAASAVQGIRIEQTLGRNLAQAIVQGADIGDAIGRAFRASGSEVLGNELEEAFTGALEKAFQNFKFSDDPQTMQNITAGFALAIGQALGGNVVQGALTAVGTGLGAFLGGLGSLGGPAGAALGATIGSFLGGLFGGSKNPRFIVGGDIGFGQLGKNLDDQFATVFGDISANFRNLERETERSIIGALRGFDNTIAAIVQDVDRMAAIENALRLFEFNSNKQGASMEDLLEARFDVILGTFDQFTQNIVRQGITLEEQVQRLGDILAIERVIDAGEGFADLERTVEILEQLGFVGETLGETFNRLNQAFNEYSNIVVGLEEQIQTTGLNDFQRELVRIQQQLLRNIDALNRTAKASGLQAAREEDLARAHEAAAVAAAKAIKRLEDATRRLVDEVFGTALSAIEAQLRNILNVASLERSILSGPLARVEDEIRSLQGASEGASTGISNLQTELARLKRFADSLLIGQFSPLPTGPRLEEAMRLLREASGRGDTGAVQQIASQVLQIAQSRFGSGQPFVDIFDEVQKIVRGTRPRETVQAVSIVESPALLKLFEERDRLLAEQEERDRRAMAFDVSQRLLEIARVTGESVEEVADRLGVDFDELLEVPGLPEFMQMMEEREQLLADQQERERKATSLDIAQAVADISQATGDAFMDVAARLGFDLEELGQILGLEGEELQEFLKGLQVDPEDIASELDLLGTRIVRAIVEDLPEALREEPTDPEPPAPPGPPHPPGPPDPWEPIVRIQGETRDAVSDGAGDIVSAIGEADRSEEIVTVLRRIADGIEREPRNIRTRMART